MIPIRTLTALELPRYRDHLLRLDEADRRLRFGFPIADAGIAAFVGGIDPLDTRLLVHEGPDLEVVGAVQAVATAWQAAEFAFSVEPRSRGRGIATALFDRAVLWARNRGIRRAYVQCLAENRAMRQIARKAGMAIVTASGESEGYLDIPAATTATVRRELIEESRGLCAFADQARGRLAAPFPVVPAAA